jgi:hypothetical protein
MSELNFLGPEYQNRSDNYSSQRLVNMYLERGQGKKQWVMLGTPGLTHEVFEISFGGVRGALRFNDDISIWVVGARVFAVEKDTFTLNYLGDVVDDGEPVTLASNGINVVVASGGTLYGTGPIVLPYADIMSIITTNVGSVDYIDGYFILNELTTGKFYISGQYTTSIDALDFATAEAAPDKLVRVLVNNREAILFGTETIEFWYNSGNVDFPFSRVQGAVVEEGLAAKNSAVLCGNTVAWLGGSKQGGLTVWSFEGYRPTQISTPAISYAIGQWSRVDDAWAFFYKHESHAFYVLTSPTESETWVYDFSTGLWHKRAWLNELGEQKRIRVNTYMNFSGKDLVGDWETGKVYEYRLDTYTDNGGEILRQRACQMIQKELKMQRNGTFRLDMDTGVGLPTGQGSNPQVMLRVSKDGGKTWGNELFRSFGQSGEYDKHVEWHRVGGGERTVFEISISDPVKVAITGAYFE